MRLREHLEREIESARRDKEALDGDDDIDLTITAWRGDEIVAVVTLRDHTPETVNAALMMSATGYAPDVLALTVETYLALTPLDPLTGQPWGPGELQDAAERRDGIAHGWVSECILVQVVNRAGDHTSASLPYTRHGTDPVTWGDQRIADPDDDSAEGHLPDLLRKAMAHPTHAQARGVPAGPLTDGFTSELIVEKTHAAVALLEHP